MAQRPAGSGWAGSTAVHSSSSRTSSRWSVSAASRLGSSCRKASDPMDATGAPVASIGSLALRQLDPSRLAADTDQREEVLLELEWTAVEPAQPLPAGRWAIVGTDYLGLGAELADAGID